jgi:outer membrane lipoprotein carrier protein
MRVGRILVPFGVVLSLALFEVVSAAYADPDAAPKQQKSACPEGSGEQAAALIQSRYEGIRDIHAKFEQTNRSATFAGQPLMTPEPKQGRVVFAKPGKMRWSYLSPEPSLVVSDGQILWIYDVAGASITRLEVTAGFLSGAALQFLLGDGQILESFEVLASACKDDRISLDLIPKAEATYERLGLVADRNSGDVVATSVLDLFGNLTVISFSEIEINLDPPAKTFELEIPEGVEVIDYAGSQRS